LVSDQHVDDSVVCPLDLDPVVVCVYLQQQPPVCGPIPEVRELGILDLCQRLAGLGELSHQSEVVALDGDRLAKELVLALARIPPLGKSRVACVQAQSKLVEKRVTPVWGREDRSKLESTGTKGPVDGQSLGLVACAQWLFVVKPEDLRGTAVLGVDWKSPASVDRVRLGGLGRCCRDLIFLDGGRGFKLRG